VDSLAELNARVAAAEQAEDGRRIGARIRTIGQDFAAEVPLLVPVPDEPFETGLLLTPRVDRYSQVTVRMNRYSVPVRLIGRQVRVVLRSSELVIYDGAVRGCPSRAGRRPGRREARPGPHLEALMRKPGPMAGSVPLDQANLEIQRFARPSVAVDPIGSNEYCGSLLLGHYPVVLLPVVVFAAGSDEDRSAQESEAFGVKPGLGVVGTGELRLPFDGCPLPAVAEGGRYLGFARGGSRA
jgi:hypothetical protein